MFNKPMLAKTEGTYGGVEKDLEGAGVRMVLINQSLHHVLS